MNNINIDSINELITPYTLKEQLPITKDIEEFITSSRNQIRDILTRKDNRKILVVGPCSIHNVDECKTYADYLSELVVNDKILIIMRVYFEKPRTTIGWKGLINDPDLDNSYNVNKGLYLARELLIYISKKGLAIGTEILDTFTPQYIDDLISWGAIGARTTESQIHRQLVSGLSMPIGFKNSTTGDCKVALDAITSANNPHCFFGITSNGNGAIVKTKGNTFCHIILRGGKTPNYEIDHIVDLNNMSNTLNIMIDCSHGNSNKNYKNQSKVINYCMENYMDHKNIIGYMLESNINEGKQTLDKPEDLKYGVSITDSCINFEETKNIIKKLYNIIE